MLRLKDKAPDFELRDTYGNKVKLSNFKGENIILYFYPRDLTPSCTLEACNFRDDYEKYKKKNIVILGVSSDDEKLHKKFTEKHNLPFTLLCDINKEVSKKYGVYKKKKFLGKEFMGIERTTFLIDKEGKIKHISPKVKVQNHSKEILELLK